MGKEKSLYFLAGELAIRSEKSVPCTPDTYFTILQHETEGLRNMGCNVVRTPKSVDISNESNIPFFNRTIILNMKPWEIMSLINRQTEQQRSIIVNDFSQPENIEVLLVSSGAKLVLASAILGGRIFFDENKRIISQAEQRQVDTITLRTDVDKAYRLFAEFFAKAGESSDLTRTRLLANIEKGPHIIGYSEKGIPSGILGSIVIDQVGSLYCCYIDESSRRTPLLEMMISLLRKQLLDLKVNMIYLKTRNKAVFGLGKKFFGLKHLYNERVYEV